MSKKFKAKNSGKDLTSHLPDFAKWLCLSILFVAPFQWFHDIFVVPKLVVFTTILGFALILTPFEAIRKLPFKFSVLLVTTPLITLFLAFFDSVSFFENFVGDYQRYNGIFFAFISGLAIWYLSSMPILSTIKYLKLLKICMWMIVIVQIFQLAKLNPLGLVNSTSSSLMGNTNFASAVVGSLALTIFISEHRQIFAARVYLLLSAVTILFSLWKFGDAQGWLVLAVGIFTYFYFMFALKNSTVTRFLRWLYFAIWVFGILLIYSVIRIGIFEKIFNLSGNYKVRLDYWSYAIQMFIDKPLTGVGLNSFLDTAQRLKTIEQIRNDQALVWVDSAHSVPLHILATGGIFLFGAYLIFTLATSIMAILNCSQFPVEKRKSQLVLMSIWFALQAQSIVSISIASTSILNTFLAGLIWNNYLARISINDETKSINKHAKTSKMDLGQKYSIKLVVSRILGAAIIGFAMYIAIFQILMAQNVKGRLLETSSYIRTASIYPGSRSLEYLANAALVSGDPKASISVLKMAIESNPANGRPYYSTGLAYREIGKLHKAKIEIDKALDRDPKNVFYFDQLIRIQVAMQEYEHAEITLRKLSSIYPKYQNIEELSQLVSSNE